jgi:outer membrane protein assembly factor BamB
MALSGAAWAQEESLGDVAREFRSRKASAEQPETPPPASPSRPEEDLGWRISPQHINVISGEDRPLQLLDDSAQELQGAIWEVDNPALAEIEQDGDRVVVHAKAPGIVRVSASRGREVRFREIRIWDEIPHGTSTWGMIPIGKEFGDIPAVPTPFGGPNLYSLEQTPNGDTYLRATTENGIQLWAWLMPEKQPNVQLICGDWLGGAEIAATRADSYTVYAVGGDGKLRWQHTARGIRKPLAISTDHVVYLVTQSLDGTEVNLTGLEESSGTKMFDLKLPGSQLIQARVRKRGAAFTCAADNSSVPLPITATGVMVNMDGYAYLAFTQRTRTVGISECKPGSTVDQAKMFLGRRDQLILWQIHPDGTYRSSVVEDLQGKQPLSQSFNTAAPTPSVITDNLNGVLVSVRWLREQAWDKPGETVSEFVYRVDPDGEVIYKFQLPQYVGALHDEIVIGENAVAFATRGGTLIAFNVRTGKDLWKWNSEKGDLQVFAALANGHCLVQTPAALVEVEDSAHAKVVAQGKAMMDWMGNMYIKHN